MKFIHPKRLWRASRLRRMWLERHSTCKNRMGNYQLNVPTMFCGAGRIELHDTVFGFPPYRGSNLIEARCAEAYIKIGRSYINNDFYCCAEHGNITIGDDCLIGTGVQIINSDFHHISIAKRHQGEARSADVCIEDNVFIGSNVRIMKGVTVGYGAVIANSAVVFENVAPRTIVKGNPAIIEDIKD